MLGDADSDRAENDRLLAGLRELRAQDEEITAAEALLAHDDPLSVGSPRIRDTLVRLGATADAADRTVSAIESIRPVSISRDIPRDWGPDPHLTLRQEMQDEAAKSDRKRRYRLRRAIVSAFGFDVTLGAPHYADVIVPMLTLAAPVVHGAKVEWTATTAGQAGSGFTPTLFRSGQGKNRRISVTSSRIETCENGDARMISLSAPVRAQPPRARWRSGTNGGADAVARAGWRSPGMRASWRCPAPACRLYG